MYSPICADSCGINVRHDKNTDIVWYGYLVYLSRSCAVGAHAVPSPSCSRTQAPRVLGRFGMGATLLLTVLGGTAPHEVSVVSLADLVQQARRAFPDVGSAELSFQAAWHGAHERVFTLDDRNLQLLRSTRR